MGHRHGEGAAREVGNWTLQEDAGAAIPLTLDFGEGENTLVSGDSVALQVEVPASAVPRESHAQTRQSAVL